MKKFSGIMACLRALALISAPLGALAFKVSEMSSVSEMSALERTLAQEPGLSFATLDNIESSLLAMAKEGASPALVPFIDQIFVLTQNMLKAVEQQAASTQASHDASWQSWLKCHLNEPEIRNLETLKQRLWKCWQEEKSCETIHQKCENICHYSEGTRDYLCNIFQSKNVFPVKGLCGINKAYSSTRPWMVQMGLRYKAWYDDWQKAYVNCQDSTNSTIKCKEVCEDPCVGKAVECAGNQTELETAACGKPTMDCTIYQSCYGLRKEMFVNRSAEVKTEEDAYLSEYNGLMRIGCLLTGFKAELAAANMMFHDLTLTPVLSASIDECRAKIWTDDRYNGNIRIKYKYTYQNPEKPCDDMAGESPIKPGMPEWISAYYSPWTTYEPVKACINYTQPLAVGY